MSGFERKPWEDVRWPRSIVIDEAGRRLENVTLQKKVDRNVLTISRLVERLRKEQA